MKQQASGVSNTIRLWRVNVPLLVVCLAFPRAARAYIDPGSGALIWQALLAAFFGAMFYGRRIVRSVRAWLGRKEPLKPGEDSVKQ